MSGALVASVVARELFDQAGYAEDEEPSGVGRLARDLFGAESLEYGAPDQVEAARLLPGPRIEVRADVDAPAKALGIARCLSNWALSERGIPATQGNVDAVAASLLVPPLALRAARASHGTKIKALALAFVCPVWVLGMALRGDLARRRSLAPLRLVG